MSASANPALQRRMMDVPVRVDIVLGEMRLSVDELVNLTPGEVIALERKTTDPVDIYVSDRLMARGRLVVADGELGVTISEIVDDAAPF